MPARRDLPLGFQAQDGAADATALGCAGIDGVYLPAGATAHAAVSFATRSAPAFVNETITHATGRGGRRGAGRLRRGAARDCARSPGRTARRTR